jgi:hypothetical protein
MKNTWRHFVLFLHDAMGGGKQKQKQKQNNRHSYTTYQKRKRNKFTKERHLNDMP